MSEKPDNRIEISVKTEYQPERSDPGDGVHFYAYTITIHNAGALPCQLLSRHWIITDANGKVEEVRGEGVVGEQPYLRPGEGFQYTSGAILETAVGSMRGSYQMVADDGANFEADIPAFVLSIPRTLH